MTRNPECYFDEAAGRYVLPAGAQWTQVVYDHGAGPQCTSIVRLAGDDDSAAGEAWRRAAEAEWGYPVSVLICSDDDDLIEQTCVSSLLFDWATHHCA